MPEERSPKALIAIVVLSVLLIAALIFGGWAFSGRSQYKNDFDQKVAAAVSTAEAAQKTKLDQAYAEAAKQPFKTFTGPQTYGGVSFSYPKTWSAMVDQTDTSEPINGYFFPDVLPKPDDKTAFALRVELLNADYATTAASFDSQVQDGSLKATAYLPPKMVGVANAQPGLKLDGAISQDFQGSIVILKVRDKTLQVSTESKDFLGDFNNTVLPSLTFLP